MRSRLLFLAVSVLVNARAELPPTPFDYAVGTPAARERSPQRAAWEALDMPLRQLALFPGSVEDVRKHLNTQRAAPLVRSALQEQIGVLLTPENRYLSYGAKLGAMELLAVRKDGANAVARQMKVSLALPPTISDTLEKYAADRESVWLLRRRAAQSVAVTWATGEAAARKGSPRMSLWDRRYVPVEQAEANTAALIQAYVSDWYVGGTSKDGFLLGIRPTAEGFAGPTVYRKDSRGIIMAPLEQLAASSPPRVAAGVVESARWPVTGIVLRTKDSTAASIREAVERRAMLSEGLVVVVGPVRPRAVTQAVSSSLTYAGLRPPFWLQEKYRSVPISNFHLLTTRLAATGNDASFYSIARKLAKTPPPSPQSPEFFFLQALFPGTLTNAADLRSMLDAPEAFAARHLAKVVMDEDQSGKEAPWSWEFEVSLFYYWRE